MKPIADKVIDKPVRVKGFKVWGIKLPFTLKSLRVSTVIEMAGIGSTIEKNKDGTYDVQKNLPKIIDYIAIGLNNGRFRLVEKIYRKQLKKLTQEELLYLYYQVLAAWSPSLFFSLCEEMKNMKHLLIKPSKEEEGVSGEELL